MPRKRKVAVEIAPELLDKTQDAYEKLRGFRGKIRFKRTCTCLKVDRVNHPGQQT